MPKRAIPLTVRRVETEKRPGMYADGDGLYLAVTASKTGDCAKSWVFRYQAAGRRHEMGIGSVTRVSLAEARHQRRVLHDNLRSGIDPLASKIQGRSATRRMITFQECAERYIALHECEWTDKRAWPDSTDPKNSTSGANMPTIGQRLSGINDNSFCIIHDRRVLLITATEIAFGGAARKGGDKTTTPR